MNNPTNSLQEELQVSKIAENIIGSEIIKLAGEVNEKIRQGEKIFNLTIGDFNPAVFPIPAKFSEAIIRAYQNGHTNYPPADGMLELRTSISALLRERGGLDYKTDEIVVTGGGRPAIYAIFRALVDEGDTVIFPVPSWNNNHYTYLNHGKAVMVESTPENNFMPSPAEIAPFVKEASLLALCSPLNPTGTTFTKDGLEAICDMILAENAVRKEKGVKPLYVLYDQIYWALTYGETKHYDPVSLRPEMKSYTVYIDGISKSMAATGVRVGWSMGPKRIIDKMKAILGHIGAWAPKAEQVAAAEYIGNLSFYDEGLAKIKTDIEMRLDAFYSGFQELKEEGLGVEAIAPEAAMYLTVQFDLKGKSFNGTALESTKDITKFILEEAKVALVPFYAFGASEDSTWYRLSVGTCSLEDVGGVIANLRQALQKLA